MFHIGKQSTIAKTGEIIRQLGITDMSFDDDNDDEREKETREKRRKEKKKRIANLYVHPLIYSSTQLLTVLT